MAFHCVGKSSSSVERKRSWFSYETVGLIAAWTLCIRPAGCLHLRETRALRSVHLHGCLDVRLCVLNVFHHHQRHFYFRSSSHWKKLKEISRKKKQMKSTVENDRFSNHQLDGTRGWIVTAASFMSTFLTDGITFCFGLILFELVQVFDEPVEKVSWIPSFLLGIQLLSGKKNLLKIMRSVQSARNDSLYI